jgi:hypothetical protein
VLNSMNCSVSIVSQAPRRACIVDDRLGPDKLMVRMGHPGQSNLSSTRMLSYLAVCVHIGVSCLL